MEGVVLMPNKPSELALTLGKKLKEVFDDQGFVVSILSIADTDELRRKVMGFMGSNPEADIEDITLFAVNLRNARDGGPIHTLDGIE